MHPNHYRFSTHLDIQGGTQTGKTTRLRGYRFARFIKGDSATVSLIFDPKDYRETVEFLTYLDPDVPIVLVDLVNGPPVPCNWFTNCHGEPIDTHAERITKAI